MITPRSFRSTRAQIARASEIASILSASGFGWLVAALGLRVCVSLRCRILCSLGLRQCPHHVAMDQPLPDRMRLVLEHLGPTFVKIGQMLALRADYVPLAYADALRSLHAHAAPFPDDLARATVERELGRPVDVVFASFERMPFAAASLSQVHRARLWDGTVVAVKVQRPGAADQMASDLALLGFLARRIERRSPAALAFRPSAAVAEMAEFTARELDFRREARTAAEVRDHLASMPGVVIPRVFPELTTARVLTTELVEGVAPQPAAALREQGLDPAALLESGARAMFAQIFEFGLFHADPHPGNVLFLEGDRVCFLDFGMFGRLDRRGRRRMAFLLWALADGDFGTVADQLLRTSTFTAAADPARFRRDIADAIEDWSGTSAREYSIARLLVRYLSLGADRGIVFPRELMLLARALVTLEATAMIVDPDFNLADSARLLVPSLHRRLMDEVVSVDDLWREHRVEYVDLLLDLPELMPELLGRLRSTPLAVTAAAPHTPGQQGLAPLLAAGAALGYAAGRMRRRRGRAVRGRP